MDRVDDRVDVQSRFYDWECRQFLRRQWEDIPFFQSLAAPTGGPVLELGCGTGRVTFPLAEAGLEVVGVDLNPGMLERAAARLASSPPELRARVSLAAGDMTRLELGRRFPIAIIPYNGFLCLRTQAEQRACLRSIARHLLPGGLLVLEAHPFQIHTAPNEEWEHLATDFFDDKGAVLAMYERIRHDHAEQLTHFEERYVLFEPGGQAQTFESTLTLRTVHRHELTLLLEAEGFAVRALHGGFDRRAYAGADAYTLLAVAELVSAAS